MGGDYGAQVGREPDTGYHRRRWPAQSCGPRRWGSRNTHRQGPNRWRRLGGIALVGTPPDRAHVGDIGRSLPSPRASFPITPTRVSVSLRLRSEAIRGIILRGCYRPSCRSYITGRPFRTRGGTGSLGCRCRALSYLTIRYVRYRYHLTIRVPSALYRPAP